MPRATDAEIKAAMDQALDRAYAVAWALRGSVAQRDALRPGLGWIAVSGEDDMPHRPVNVPAPRYEQYEVSVRTPVPAGGSIDLATRFFVACAHTRASAGDPMPATPVRRVPADPISYIPADHHVLLFLHGHGSGAEEALDIIPHLLEQGRQRGRKYAVVCFDLPNNGYSESFDHQRIAAASATTFPFLPTDNTPLATPVLDFIEDFVVAFVDALENDAIQHGTPRIKHRIAGVFGGSLGGNLGLRLGRRSPMPDWMPSIVAWSPASVWKAKVKGDIGREGSRVSRDNFTKEQNELHNSRANYFNLVYDKSQGIIEPQPNYWYGKSFSDAPAHITRSRWSRREIYNPSYRLWHWRVACEQLIYSHAENVVYGDSSTPIRYTLNTIRTLLATGAEDNASFVRIYSATEKVGTAMTGTPGRLLLVNNTGHSIHVERPLFFATQIAAFLSEDALPALPGGAQPFLALLLDEAPKEVKPPEEVQRRQAHRGAGSAAPGASPVSTAPDHPRAKPLTRPRHLRRTTMARYEGAASIRRVYMNTGGLTVLDIKPTGLDWQWAACTHRSQPRGAGDGPGCNDRWVEGLRHASGQPSVHRARPRRSDEGTGPRLRPGRHRGPGGLEASARHGSVVLRGEPQDRHPQGEAEAGTGDHGDGGVESGWRHGDPELPLDEVAAGHGCAQAS